MESALVTFEIYIDNRLHGMRRNWPSVPRVGDLLTVNVDDDIKRLPVVAVVWGMDAEPRGQFGCAVHCSPDAG